MIGQCAATTPKGTVPARNGSADATTIKLMDLLRMTASSATNRKALISSGNRNSAPPNPINPPSAPITAPPPKAAGAPREAGADIDGACMASPARCVQMSIPPSLDISIGFVALAINLSRRAFPAVLLAVPWRCSRSWRQVPGQRDDVPGKRPSLPPSGSVAPNGCFPPAHLLVADTGHDR